MDSYYLNDAVEKLNEFLSRPTTRSSPAKSCSSGARRTAGAHAAPSLMQKMAAQVEKGAPAGRIAKIDVEVLSGAGEGARRAKRVGDPAS